MEAEAEARVLDRAGMSVGLGGLDLGADFFTLEGFVKARSLFSLSSSMDTTGEEVASCSMRLFRGAKTLGGLMEGSIGRGEANFRCSSIRHRGAVTMFLFADTGFTLMS